MQEQIKKAVFYRKAIHISELKETCDERHALPFHVERIAEVSQSDFAKFSGELYEYYKFIYDNRDAMYFQSGEQSFHCLLVTTPERKEGVLIQSEGYAYARYAAYIEDCSRLDLSQAEVLKEASMSHELPSAYYRMDVSQNEKCKNNFPER